MERKCPFLSIWTPDLPVHFGQSFNIEAIRSIHRNPQRMYAKQPKWTESWEKAALRTEGVRTRRHYQTSIILSCNHKQSSHKIMKKMCCLPKAYSNSFQWKLTDIYIKGKSTLVASVWDTFLVYHDTWQKHGAWQKSAALHLTYEMCSNVS